jgi:hypothetical protein
MTEPVQMMLPFDCKECFLKGCECKCATCVAEYQRNMRFTNLELVRLSVEKQLGVLSMPNEVKTRILEKLKGMGI